MTCSGGAASSDRGPILLKRIRVVRMRALGREMNPYTRNDVFRRGYPLDWDGPMSLGSVNSGPVPTGRPTVLGLVYLRDKELEAYGTEFACGTDFACGTEIAYGTDFHVARILHVAWKLHVA